MINDLKTKLEESIDLLNKGQAVKLNEFVIQRARLKSNMKILDRLEVNGYIYNNSISIQDVPRSIIKPELQKIKENFAKMINESQIFKEYALKIGIDYYLVLDCQNAGIVICSEINGEYIEF